MSRRKTKRLKKRSVELPMAQLQKINLPRQTFLNPHAALSQSIFEYLQIKELLIFCALIAPHPDASLRNLAVSALRLRLQGYARQILALGGTVPVDLRSASVCDSVIIATMGPEDKGTLRQKLVSLTRVKKDSNSWIFGLIGLALTVMIIQDPRGQQPNYLQGAAFIVFALLGMIGVCRQTKLFFECESLVRDISLVARMGNYGRALALLRKVSGHSGFYSHPRPNLVKEAEKTLISAEQSFYIQYYLKLVAALQQEPEAKPAVSSLPACGIM